MSDMVEFEIKAPASTANFGPGFDCLSASLDVFNLLKCTLTPSATLSVSHLILDENRNPLTVPTEQDLTVAGVTECLAVLGHSLFQPQNPIHDETMLTSLRNDIQRLFPLSDRLASLKSDIYIISECDIPISRGMGSSTAAYQGGILCALAALCGAGYWTQLCNHETGELKNPVQNFIAHLCIAREGHPDNAIACAYGGAQCMMNDSIKSPHGVGKPCFEIGVSPSLHVHLIIPERKTSTAEARKVMPHHYPRGAVVDALKNVMTVVRGLELGNIDMIKSSFDNEAIHIPYRGALNPHLQILKDFLTEQAASLEGTTTCTLSGSGSTLLVLADNQQDLTSLKTLVARLEGDMRAREMSVSMGGRGVHFVSK